MSGTQIQQSKLITYQALATISQQNNKLISFQAIDQTDIRQIKQITYLALSPAGVIPPFGPIPIFPTLPQDYPINLNLVMDTTIGTTKALREMRVAQQTYPIWDIEIPFTELRDQTQNETIYSPNAGYTNYMQLVQIWLSMYGQAGVFGFLCPWDYSRTNQLIGVGDGSTYVFNVYRTWGTGATATTAPVGLINSVSQIQIGGTTISPAEYQVGRDKITFTDISGNIYAPANGQSITITFTYYYLCRFVEDEQNFEEFLKNRWSVNPLKFRAVLWI